MDDISNTYSGNANRAEPPKRWDGGELHALACRADRTGDGRMSAPTECELTDAELIAALRAENAALVRQARLAERRIIRAEVDRVFAMRAAAKDLARGIEPPTHPNRSGA